MDEPGQAGKHAAPGPSFEAALEELEAVVEQLEQGQLTLEAALQRYEEGLRSYRRCRAILEEAERRVEILDAEGARPYEGPLPDEGEAPGPGEDPEGDSVA